MENIKDFKVASVPIDKILLAVTSRPDYEMDRIYVIEGFPDWKHYAIVNGGHCSCYDFGQTSWDATIYTPEEISKVMAEWREHGYETEMVVARLWYDTGRK